MFEIKKNRHLLKQRNETKQLQKKEDCVASKKRENKTKKINKAEYDIFFSLAFSLMVLSLSLPLVCVCCFFLYLLRVTKSVYAVIGVQQDDFNSTKIGRRDVPRSIS